MVPPLSARALPLCALCVVAAPLAADRGVENGGAASELERGAPPPPRTVLATQEPGLPPLREQDPAVRAAIERGLAYLSAQQASSSDGSLPSVGRTGARLAVTSLGALAWMAGGSVPGRGPHGREVGRAVDYLAARVERDPSSRSLGYIADPGDPHSRMHGHGFATLALAEAYAISPRAARGARVTEALELALRCIEGSQSVEGGWDYKPVRGLEHEGSITICLVQAMRSAKSAGLRVDPQVIRKAEDYVHRSQADNGGFRYALGNEQITVALTAAAISTLNAAGRYHGPEIRQGYDYIERELRARAEGILTGEQHLLRPDGTPEFPYYERLYLAQALWQNPDRARFETWFAEEREEVLKTQEEDGSWGDPRFGATYGTAMNVLVLALPDQLLPAFQR